MKLSIIIPTFQEEENIERCLQQFLLHKDDVRIESIWVIDGGSTDSTLQKAQALGAKTAISPIKGRAGQMNYGAQLSQGSILYFVHADVKVPPSFLDDIQEAIKKEFDSGCYRYVFDSPKRLLKINAWFTRKKGIMCRGGDQTLFVKRTVFDDLNGFKSEFRIMEDYDFILRLRKRFQFFIVPKNVIVSARKYETNSYIRVNLANLIVFIMFFSGASQKSMVKTYKNLLNYR